MAHGARGKKGDLERCWKLWPEQLGRWLYLLSCEDEKEGGIKHWKYILQLGLKGLTVYARVHTTD